MTATEILYRALERRIRSLETETANMQTFLQRQFPGDFLAELPDSLLVAAPDLNPTDFSRVKKQ